MKRKSTRAKKANVSYETESDPDESLSSRSDENFDANVDRSTLEVEEPKEKKRKGKGKNAEPKEDEGEKLEDNSKQNNSPQKKVGRGRKSKDLEFRSEEIKEAEEVEAIDTDPEKDTPQRKLGRGRKARDPEKSILDANEDSDYDEENEVVVEDNSQQKNNSSQKKAGRGRKSKDLQKSKSDDIKETEEDDEEEEEKDSEYEVEKIIDEKMIRGKRHFLIRWKGYDAESDTWEPAASLNCPSALEIYKNTKGTLSKNKDIKGKKNKKRTEHEEEWDDNENFEVVRILDVYFRKDGKKEFLVAWKGYPNSANSWEPEENMDCKDMIKRFLEKCDRAKEATQKDLRMNRKVTDRFTLSTKESGRRLSKRNQGGQRVHYHDAE